MRNRNEMKLTAAIVSTMLLAIGCVGPAGDPGTNGTDGKDGLVGQNGTAGQAGLDGQDGTTGPAGQDGGTGPQGGSCAIVNNNNGTYTINCDDGSTVTVNDGETGATGGAVLIEDKHGTQHLADVEYEESGKHLVTVTITSASASATGQVVVNFSVADAGGNPVADIATVSANIAKLVPPGAGEVSNNWVPYIYRTQTAGTGDWNNAPYNVPATTVTLQANRESNGGSGNPKGTLTNNGDGTYTYTFGNNIANVATPAPFNTPVAYDRNLTHRISIMMGGSAGPTGSAEFDFVPDGTTANALTRDIIQTANCQQCHGNREFHGHGGDRITIGTCVTCHNPSTVDAQSGNTLDMKVMIHKIHAGYELPSVMGPDLIAWDDPATGGDESDDNGQYTIWGYQNRKISWEKVAFPAVIENCTKCHQGTGVDVDNWKEKPSREACGSCHDDVNFANGMNHPSPGGAQPDDSNCGACHGPTASKPVTDVHNWTAHKDRRNLPEFSVSITMNTPARGYYLPGTTEAAPEVYIAMTDISTSTLLDHTTISTETSTNGEGCTAGDPRAAACPARDNKFTAALLFVHGPRDNRRPVLTTAARAEFVSIAEPFDLSSATSLIVKTDGGQNIPRDERGAGGYADVWYGSFKVVVTCGSTASECSSVAVPFATPVSATAAEVVAWLNGNPTFAARAIAEVRTGNKVAIRSRGKGNVTSLQLLCAAAACATTDVAKQLSAIGALDSAITAVKWPTGSTAGNNFITDARATKTAGYVKYQLDAVDDLEPGTYIASVEIADAGRVSATNYRTPSVARVAFNVGQATAEPQVAGNCAACHQGPDANPVDGDKKGFVLDFARHYKIFNNTAVDQCGACHDYQPEKLVAQATSAGSMGWTGARPIARRVHAIHYGSSLNYPLSDVDYGSGDPVPGRAWDITLPQDVRNCDTTCHTPETSGTWKTEPSRLPCAGCHETDAATAHIKIMTYDPTPAEPWSGDEAESCKVCHAPIE